MNHRQASGLVPTLSVGTRVQTLRVVHARDAERRILSFHAEHGNQTMGSMLRRFMGRRSLLLGPSRRVCFPFVDTPESGRMSNEASGDR
jgi:hypothetical protein